jgi:hypothetical protein
MARLLLSAAAVPSDQAVRRGVGTARVVPLHHRHEAKLVSLLLNLDACSRISRFGN